MEQAIIILLLGLARATRAMQKAFLEIPGRELRCRAAKGDESAHKLYQAARYNGRLKFFLEAVIIIFLSTSSYLIFSSLETAWAITAIAVIILYFFVYSPASQTRPLSRKMAEAISPALSSVMKFVNPAIYIIKPAKFGERVHEPFYDHADMVDFLNWQTKVEDSRISKKSIRRAVEALEHRDKLVKDVMTDKKSMVVLRPNEKVGPILLSELHKSGQEYFAVSKRKGEIEGIVSLSRLTKLKEGGVVIDAMKRHAAYLSQDETLPEAAAAFLSTKEKAYLVINKKGEVIGIIRFSKILEKLTGLEEKDLEKNYYEAEKITESTS